MQAVVNLVSSSVEGLEPAQVTLADSSGNVLSTAGADGASTLAGDAYADGSPWLAVVARASR